MDELWAGVFATTASALPAPSVADAASGQLGSAALQEQPRSDVSGAATGESGVPQNEALPTDSGTTDGAEPRASSSEVRREDASTITGDPFGSSVAFDEEGSEQAWDEWDQTENGR
jgi:hypothetical protein